MSKEVEKGVSQVEVQKVVRKDLWDQFRPTNFGFVKLCFQSLLDDLVSCFDQAVRLGIGRRGEAKADLEVGA